MTNKLDTSKWGWIVFLVSSSTLVCCVIPIMLVSLGLGAVVASLFSNVPFLATLAEHKVWTFIVSAILLMFASWAVYRRTRVCPADPILAAKCESAFRWNKRLLWLSATLWIVSFFISYLLVPILEYFE